MPRDPHHQDRKKDVRWDNADAAHHLDEEREWLIPPGEWEVVFVGYRLSGAYGGRFIALAHPLAGPIVDGVARWRRNHDPQFEIPVGFDDPLIATIPRWYAADTRGGRVAAKPKSDLCRDWYRLTGERPQSFTRFPVTGFLNRRARVTIETVSKDHRGLDCIPYSKIREILGP